MKKIFTLIATVMLSMNVFAAEEVTLLELKNYEFANAWDGKWSGYDPAKEQDWSEYDYIWVKYSGLVGGIQLGIYYSEWLKKESWGDSFASATVSFSGEEGIAGLKLDKNSVYVKGNAETDGQYIGDIYAKHIREIFVQATANSSSVTIEGIWLGTEREYLTAIGYNFDANHALEVKNGEAAANMWDRQAICTLNTPMEAGKVYVVEVAMMADNMGDCQPVPIYSTSDNRDQWGNSADVQYLAVKTVSTEFSVLSWEFTAAYPHDKLQFFIGKMGGSVYFDNISCKEKDTDVEMVDNGDFEIPSISNWAVLSYTGQTMQHVEKEYKVFSYDPENNPRLHVSNGEAAANDWDRQAICTLNASLETGKTYMVKATIMAENGGKCKLVPIFSTSENVNQYGGSNDVQYLDEKLITSTYQEITWIFQANFPHDKLQFFIGLIGGEVYFDDVSCKEMGTDTDLVDNGSFDDEDISNWAVIEYNGQTMERIGGESDETPTSIRVANMSNKTDNSIFDLQGRRVANPVKGLYIINGKKMIIK